MALLRKNLHWDPRAYEVVAREAALRGESTAEYIRVAALSRAFIDMARRDPALVAHLGAVFDSVAENVGSYLDEERRNG